MIRSKSKYCMKCDQQTRFVRPDGPNHILHLLLSLISVGLWLPVWALIVLCSMTERYCCHQCGSK